MSFPRLADLELLASLSSSQPGLLKREREEEEEQEQEGEPDSKKSNTVEEESKGLEKEAGSWKTDVVKAKKEGKLAEENKAEQINNNKSSTTSPSYFAFLNPSSRAVRYTHRIFFLEERSHPIAHFQRDQADNRCQGASEWEGVAEQAVEQNADDLWGPEGGERPEWQPEVWGFSEVVRKPE